jgi:predicted O-methyltransferase YrrM
MYPAILQKFDNLLVKYLNKYINYRWYNSPLAKNVKADKDEYLKIWEYAKSKSYKLIDNFEQRNNQKIDKDWYHELALHTQVVIKKSEICYAHGRLLYSSLKSYIEKHRYSYINIIETGTARGFSALCMAKAMEDANACGKIITFDVLPHNVKMYWNCIDDNDGKKTRSQLLLAYKSLTEKYIIFHQGNTKIELPKLQTHRIHFAFLDSAHDYYYLMSEFQYLLDKQKKNDIIFFDDYTPLKYPGVVKAVDEICETYKYSKEIITLNENRAFLIAMKL